ncbi:hypothetical protein BpHYR1_013319 [Brachionus plicatilis]|uniref:Uncharacterized protein n=1 Tax=Brachionus plicatilis TaxID=10195 RepID=A0A3M7QU30_BRAPC|nr:hypothetical protein BpHYR1_013319 [Brachionus plicatilis]
MSEEIKTNNRERVDDNSIEKTSSIIFVAIVKKPAIEFVWLSSESEDEANEGSNNKSGKSSICSVPKESQNGNLNDTVNDAKDLEQ